MIRFKLTIEYDGTPYAGWQRQENAPSVQQAIEEAIFQHQKVPVQLCVAGRTDAGVHARGQVAHVDLPDTCDAHTLFRGTNHFLKNHSISILKVEPVDKDFHARFSAKWREYEYIVLNRKSPPALDARRVWHVSCGLNLEAMQRGAAQFLGHHDFTSFRTVHCQAATPLRTIDGFDVFKKGDYVYFKVKAPSFLHHQVRNMVGTLVDIGKERFQPDDIPRMLSAKDRSVAGPTAPALGLYFLAVHYA